MTDLRDIGEDELVRQLTARLPQSADVLTGPGDDCAVVSQPLANLVLKVDAVVEGVHFLRDAPPHLIGRKALARAISDMAAMGATPRYALVTLVLPPELEVAYVRGLYDGLVEVGQPFGISIVGGETTRGMQIIVSVALTGEAGTWVTRGAASAGDVLFVTGRLGGSIHGHHFTFQPRITEAHWLVKHLPPTAMMDLSDGLAKDLPRLALASGTEFKLDSPLPCTPGCDEAQAWGDGEDYELLFATTPEQAADLPQHWPFPEVPLTRIGQLVPCGQGELPTFTTTGWDPFSKTL